MHITHLFFTILFGLSESSKIILYKYFILEIIETKVTEKCKKKHFQWLWPQFSFRLRSLNKVILDDSNRLNAQGIYIKALRYYIIVYNILFFNFRKFSTAPKPEWISNNLLRFITIKTSYFIIWDILRGFSVSKYQLI